MTEVKWIKITTGMFEDEKIDFIESLPERDTILIMWVKLLTLAGKINNHGFIYLTENIPYTDEMLAHKFKRPLSTVKLALETFKRLEMIESDGEIIKITNWSKHQNIEGMEKIREQNRIRKQKQREKERGQKLLENENIIDAEKDSHVMSRDSHATEIEKDIEKDKEKDKDYMSAIKDYRTRYVESELKTIDEFFDILRHTRRSGRIADSVTAKIYKKLDRHPKEKVLYGLKTYIDKPKLHDKKEDYVLGIVRNASASEYGEFSQNRINSIANDENPYNQ